jgi:hypothetical protein
MSDAATQCVIIIVAIGAKGAIITIVNSAVAIVTGEVTMVVSAAIRMMQCRV